MLLQPSEAVMAEEIVYADLRHPRDGSSPTETRHAPAVCPRWHGVLLKASALGHLILLVVVLVLSVQASHPRSFLQVFEGSLKPATTSAPQQGGEIQGRNCTERCVLASLIRYICKPQRGSPTAGAGCKLCPQDWRLYRDRCYQLSKEMGNWTEAKKGCKDQGSHLVVLRDEEEKEYIKNITGGGLQPVWIGLTPSHKRWKWVDNTPFNATIFGTLKKVDEGCVALKDKRLEGNICNAEHEWVCQKDPFPLIPPSMVGDGEMSPSDPEMSTL